MHLAYHMIGLSTLDTGRLGRPMERDPSILDDIVGRAKARYNTIRGAGILLPNKEDIGPLREGNFFIEDMLAEDNRFVFLSVGRRYWQEPAVVNFGFLFDAAKLIEQGAILRQHDLAQEYDDLLGEIVGGHTGFREPTEWSPEEQATLFAALDAPDEHPGYIGPNDAYYTLLDAVRDRHDEVPGVREVIAEFRSQAKRLQEAVQMRGAEALRYLEAGKTTPGHELLVPDRLDLSEAWGVIEYGKMYAL